jgi:hypothetical protein
VGKRKESTRHNVMPARCDRTVPVRSEPVPLDVEATQLLDRVIGHALAEEDLPGLVERLHDRRVVQADRLALRSWCAARPGALHDRLQFRILDGGWVRRGTGRPCRPGIAQPAPGSLSRCPCPVAKLVTMGTKGEPCPGGRRTDATENALTSVAWRGWRFRRSTSRDVALVERLTLVDRGVMATDAAIGELTPGKGLGSLLRNPRSWL